jgi:hypothetical protein
LRGVVPRYTKLRYTGFDIEGNPIDRVAEGFHARVVQHECDHLDGILYPQRMTDMSARSASRRSCSPERRFPRLRSAQPARGPASAPDGSTSWLAWRRSRCGLRAVVAVAVGGGRHPRLDPTAPGSRATTRGSGAPSGGESCGMVISWIIPTGILFITVVGILLILGAMDDPPSSGNSTG